MDNLQPNFYANIPAFVRYDEDLKPNAKLLYGEITALTSMKGYCWATNSYFAELYKVDPNTVSRWISQLVKKEYIVLELIHKENSKEIKERRLYLSNAHFMKKEEETVYIKKSTPIDKKVDTPIDEKVKDITTSFINTNEINNTELENSDCVVSLEDEKKKTKKKKTNKHTKEQEKMCIELRDYYKSFERLNEASEVRGMSPKRMDMILDKIEKYSFEEVKEAIEKLAVSKQWLLDQDWFSFNWLFEKEDNFQNVLEGKHVDKSLLNNTTNQTQTVNQYNPVDTNSLFEGGEF